MLGPAAVSAIALVVGALCGFWGYRLGHGRGLEDMWHELLRNRTMRGQALERLAAEHGAKLEIHEPAGME